MKLVTATIKIDSYPPGSEVLISDNLYEALFIKGQIDRAIGTVEDSDTDSIEAVKAECRKKLYEAQAPEREEAKLQRYYQLRPEERPKPKKVDKSNFKPTITPIGKVSNPAEKQPAKKREKVGASDD